MLTAKRRSYGLLYPRAVGQQQLRANHVPEGLARSRNVATRSNTSIRTGLQEAKVRNLVPCPQLMLSAGHVAKPSIRRLECRIDIHLGVRT